MNTIKKIKTKLDEKTMLYIAVGFFIGFIVGFILAPVKNGIKNVIAIGSYNGNKTQLKNPNNVKKVKDKAKKITDKE